MDNVLLSPHFASVAVCTFMYLDNPMDGRSLVGCSPWGRTESDMTERLQFHFSLLCIGEGNGNPLQCSCLENPRDRGAWWAAVYGVAQSWTRLKWLSSSSSSRMVTFPNLEEVAFCRWPMCPSCALLSCHSSYMISGFALWGLCGFFCGDRSQCVQSDT